MNPHLHISALNFTVFLAYLILAHALLRTLAGFWPDSKFAKALAFVA